MLHRTRSMWRLSLSAALGPVHALSRILQEPTSPANAGAQIHPEQLGMMRHHAASVGTMLVGSIWIPAFAGTVGFWGTAPGSSRPILAPSAPSALLPRRGKKEAHLLPPPYGGGRPCEAWSGGGLRPVRLPPLQTPPKSARRIATERRLPSASIPIAARDCRLPRTTQSTPYPAKSRAYPKSTHPPQNRPHNGPTSSRGKGAWPATIVAAGGGRAGTGSRGILERSGDLMLVRPARRRRGRG